MPETKTYILCGLSRLTIRVARLLAADGAHVLVVRTGPDDLQSETLAEVATIRDATSESLPRVLHECGIASAACVLTLADDDLDNLRSAVAARQSSPDVPVVMRTFDPSIAAQLESGLGARRAFSVSALGGPAFAAAAMGYEQIEALQIGGTETVLVKMAVRPGAPFAGQSVAQIRDSWGCKVLAREANGRWSPVPEDGGPVNAGDTIVVGGLLADVVRFGLATSPLSLGEGSRRRLGDLFLRPPRPAGRRTPVNRLPQIAVVLAILLAAAVYPLKVALGLSWVDAIYFTLTTATTTGYGDISLMKAPVWAKAVGVGVMLSGGALLAVLFSQLAAVATADRLEAVIGRRARTMRGHVVVVGLGNLGYRTARLLQDAGLDVAVLEMDPQGRFVATLRTSMPVLIGDGRLADDLQRVGVGECAAVIACSSNELANIQACLHARRLNPRVTTVARIFDDALAERLSGAFAIDHALSASLIASRAFIGAATDERAYRTITLGDDTFLARRYTANHPIELAEVDQWRAQGIRILAYRPKGATPMPPSDLPALINPGDEIVICGAEHVVRAMDAGIV